MPELRLTKRVIELLPYPQSGQVLYRDCTLPGFGLRVGARSKVYFVEGRVDRQNIRATLGRADLMAPELARKKAMQVLGDMAAGKNPNRGKAPEERLTVARAFARFFEAKPIWPPVRSAVTPGLLTKMSRRRPSFSKDDEERLLARCHVRGDNLRETLLPVQ